MANVLTVKLDGIDELKRALADASVKIRTKAVRGALREAGKVIQSAARAAAPVLSVPHKGRSPGTVKKNIVVRVSKFSRQAGDEGVFIGVRPIRGKARIKRLGRAGAGNPNDPYYWWWQEFGWVSGSRSKTPGGKRRRALAREKRITSGTGRKIPGKLFMTSAGKAQGEAAITRFMQSVVPQIEKLNNKAAKK